MCPSNVTGIVGIKPTVGLWSRSGIIPISYTQDTAGPMSRTVRDAAKLLGAVTGIDPDDPRTSESEKNYHKDYTKFLNKNGLISKRIGYMKTMEGKNHRVPEIMFRAIEATMKDSIEMLYFNLERMKHSQSKGNLDSKIYKASLQNMLKTFREQGIDRVCSTLWLSKY